MLSAIEIANLRAQGVPESRIAELNLGALPMASFGDPQDAPMGVATGPNEHPMGLPTGVSRYDDNGNPIINPDELTPAITGLGTPAPDSALKLENPAVYQTLDELADAKLAAGEPLYEGVEGDRQEAMRQLDAYDTRPRAAASSGGAPPPAIGGPGGPIEQTAHNAMMGGQQQQQMADPFGGFAAGFASSQAPAYSGGFQALAHAMGQGSLAMRKEMAAERKGLSGKYGNTPIPYRKPDGTMGMGRMAPDGTFLPVDIPGGGEFLKPTQFLNTGQGYIPVTYGDTGGTPGAPEIPIDVAPAQTVQHQTEVEQAKKDVAWTAKRREQQPTAYRGVTKANQDTIFLTGQIDDAIDMVDQWSVGATSYLSDLPGTDAKALNNKLSTIKGRIAISSMIDMKSQGGTMGALSEKELQLLQNFQGTLDQASTPAQLKKALLDMRKSMGESRTRINSAYNEDYGSLREYKSKAIAPRAEEIVIPGWVADEDREVYIRMEKAKAAGTWSYDGN